MEITKEQQKMLAKLFPFEYKGGGYFRKKDVKQGVSAEMLHGHEAVEYLFLKMLDKPDTTC